VVVAAIREVRTPRPALSAAEFDTFSVALGLALIAGGLALLAPFLNSLTGALVALAAAGWAAGVPRTARGWTDLTPPARMGGVLLLGLGVVAYLGLSGSLDAGRGLVLAASLVPLWMIERRRGVGRAYPKGVFR
jgi:hypothetical protein